MSASNENPACKKKKEMDCLPPCKYYKGAKRQFCGLPNNNTRKRIVTSITHFPIKYPEKGVNDRENCTIMRTLDAKWSKPGSSVSPKTSSSPAFSRNSVASDACSPAYIPEIDSPTKIAKFTNDFKTKNATRKIRRFIKNVNPHKRRSYFLKSVCSDSGVCIAFGKESLTIKKHFNNFQDFRYLIGQAKQIGKVSVNGIIKELTYENEGYVVNSILKSSRNPRSDNLLYEGLVGEYLNKMGLLYPCFVETYGLYKYTSDEYETIRNNDLNHPESFKTGLTLVSPITIQDLNAACKESTRFALNIQHLKDTITMGMFVNVYLNIPTSYEIISLLYQIYMPLSMMADTFTHYDLHLNNVLVYTPNMSKYIHYHYHTQDGGITSFKSSHLVKIIDYGRCFFKDVKNKSVFGNSKKLHIQLCKMPDCEKCGSSSGFKYLTFDKSRIQRNYIYSQQPNASHDLRLLYNVKHNLFSTPQNVTFMARTAPELYDILQNLVYGVGIVREDSKIYGTQEIKTSGLPNKIHNVVDAYKQLNSIIRGKKYETINEYYYNTSELTKLGDMHIYTDGRMIEFIPAK